MNKALDLLVAQVNSLGVKAAALVGRMDAAPEESGRALRMAERVNGMLRSRTSVGKAKTTLKAWYPDASDAQIEEACKEGMRMYARGDAARPSDRVRKELEALQAKLKTATGAEKDALVKQISDKQELLSSLNRAERMDADRVGNNKFAFGDTVRIKSTGKVGTIQGAGNKDYDVRLAEGGRAVVKEKDLEAAK